jgi:UDP-N-acetylmuramate: L-alanyl-gamma-D-glutamyl-meso-diaminopimelate ligase
MNSFPKWVHIIGICGVVTSGLAVMFKYKGAKVTGSDKGFYPPVNQYLEKYDIPIGVGYNKNRLTDEDGNHPDLIILQGLKSSKNPEVEEAIRLNLKIENFPNILKKYVISENSIVVAGTYGKTTISSALVDMFLKDRKLISYMFGGLTPDMKETIIPRDKSTEYSIVEGDEYMVSLDEPSSKFFYFSPKYLVLNSCQWEHPDMFNSESEYVANFEKLVQKIPTNGIIVANANDENVVKITQNSKSKVVYYSANKEHSFITPNWYLEKQSKPLPTFVKINHDISELEIIPYERKIIGEFNEENLLAASVMAYELGVKKERIQEAIEQYQGIKRRLEIKFQRKDLLVIDDFGSSPPKAAGSIKALREDYPDSSLYVIFEPNTGNRTLQSIETYKSAFEGVDEVIFPRFTRLPKSDLKRMNETELAEVLKPMIPEITVMPDDETLLKVLVKYADLSTRKHKIIVFMGSHGFRGMIDKLVQYLHL